MSGEAVSERVVAIHQPNFLPWLGYFDKLARADAFVVLDDVQYPRRSSGTWMNRTKLVIGGEAKWATAPIDRSYEGVRLVREMRFDESRPWRQKLLRTVEQNYRRALHFEEAWAVVERVVAADHESLLEYNLHGIRVFAEAMEIDTGTMVLSSTLEASAAATERLIELTRAAGGNIYLAGGGAEGYQEDDLFSAGGVELRYQGFDPPTYPQLAPESLPGVSVVDAMMNLGPRGARELMG